MPTDNKGEKVEPGIWALKGGRGYIAEVSVTDPHTLVRVRRCRTVNRLDMARKWRESCKTDALRGEIERRKKVDVVPFSQCADEYLASWSLKRKASTVHHETNRIEGILKPYFKRKPIHTITRAEIERFLERRREGEIPDVAAKRRNTRKGGISKATANRELCRLKNMFKFAVNRGYIERNPADGITQERERVEEADFLTREEVAALLANARPEILPLLTVAVNTGMRWGELMQLTWGDVSFERGLITVRTPKNDETRYVPMNAAVLEVLQEHRTSQAKEMDELVEHVFINPQTRKPYVDVRKLLSKSLKKAKITRDITFHELRHTAASNMVMAGIASEAVGRILGHKDPKMTKRYTHLAPDYLKNSVEKLDYSVKKKEGEASGNRVGG